MKEEKYYVYDKYGGHHKFYLYELEYFVVKNGPWCFGNNFKDKRWSFKIRKHNYGYCRKPVLENEGTEELRTVKYVVYDEDYLPVACKTIDQIYVQGAHAANIYPKYRRSSRGSWQSRHPNYPGFRNGPVPGVGGWGNGSYYRRVRTTQEKKFNCAHKKYTRGKRRNLPCAWDDIKISDHYTGHSWKKQRKKKQWM